MLNAIRTVINPQVPGEQPPEGTERRLREYLTRMFRYCSQSLRRIFDWQKTHIEVVPPSYESDPHIQYWHKTKTAAYAGLYYHDLINPKILIKNAVVANYTDRLIDDMTLQSDIGNGTITIPDGQQGVYFISLSGYVRGIPNSSYAITVFNNGDPTAIRCPVLFRGTNSGMPFFNSVIANLSRGTLSVVLESPGNRNLRLLDLKFYVVRYTDGLVQSLPDSSVFLRPTALSENWGNTL